jgi:hypothetical protein
MTTDDTRPCDHDWVSWFANTSQCSRCGARRDDLAPTTDDTRPLSGEAEGLPQVSASEWYRKGQEAERDRYAALVEDAGYLADAAKHLTDHLASEHPEWYCEDMNNVQHFAVKVRAALASEEAR